MCSVLSCVSLWYPFLTVSQSLLSSYRKKGKKGKKRKGREGGDQNANRTDVHNRVQISQPKETSSLFDAINPNTRWTNLTGLASAQAPPKKLLSNMISKDVTRIYVRQMSNRNQSSSETQTVSSKFSVRSSETRILLPDTTTPPKQDRSSETRPLLRNENTPPKREHSSDAAPALCRIDGSADWWIEMKSSLCEKAPSVNSECVIEGLDCCCVIGRWFDHITIWHRNYDHGGRDRKILIWKAKQNNTRLKLSPVAIRIGWGRPRCKG